MLVFALVIPAGAWAAGASAKTVTFSGSCQFSGPITPMPPITVVPKAGAHFSYQGTGTCRGTLQGPIAVTFTDVATVFDTCELGPDVGLTGTAVVGSGAQRARFTITIDLARLALAGPFLLTTTGGGTAAGVAQFQPTNASGAPQQCASTGVASATLSGSFQTISPLVGSADPAGRSGGSSGGSGHRRHRHHRHGRGRGSKHHNCHRRDRCSIDG